MNMPVNNAYLASVPSNLTPKFSDSIRTRILILVASVVIIFSISYSGYAIYEFQKLSKLNVLHEGEILSNILKISIEKPILSGNFKDIQDTLNRFVSLRAKNDVEINVIFLNQINDLSGSRVIASNVPDNIEQTDPEEHQELLNALKLNTVFLELDIEDDELEDETEFQHRQNKNHPDHYFPVGDRFINITTPLIFNNKAYGSINVKLSLSFLDVKQREILSNILIALVILIALLILAISSYLKLALFNPLDQIAKHIYLFGIGLIKESSEQPRRFDELGILLQELNIMMSRLSAAEKMNLNYKHHLEELVAKRTEKLILTQEATMISMGALAESRDPETGGHIKRTQTYVKTLAKRLQKNEKYRDYLDDETIEQLYKSAPLHDIGKVGIADHILLKPGKLTDAEFEIMKTHTTLGGDALAAAEKILGKNCFLKYAKEIAYFHQEKWDGSGYPIGLKGEEIPISARLMAVADVYDALISKRCYKAAFSHEKAVNIITKGKGTHFDPDMVDAFIELQFKFRQIAKQYDDHVEPQTLSFG